MPHCTAFSRSADGRRIHRREDGVPQYTWASHLPRSAGSREWIPDTIKTRAEGLNRIHPSRRPSSPRPGGAEAKSRVAAGAASWKRCNKAKRSLAALCCSGKRKEAVRLGYRGHGSAFVRTNSRMSPGMQTGGRERPPAWRRIRPDSPGSWFSATQRSRLGQVISIFQNERSQGGAITSAWPTTPPLTKSSGYFPPSSPPSSETVFTFGHQARRPAMVEGDEQAVSNAAAPSRQRVAVRPRRRRRSQQRLRRPAGDRRRSSGARTACRPRPADGCPAPGSLRRRCPPKAEEPGPRSPGPPGFLFKIISAPPPVKVVGETARGGQRMDADFESGSRPGRCQ